MNQKDKTIMRRKEEKEGEEKGKEVGRKGGRERKKWGERGSEEKEGVGGRDKTHGWLDSGYFEF